MSDLVSQIMDFENGDLDDNEILELFSELISTGMAWSLQGMYGRTASSLIENDYLAEDGEILVVF